MSTQPKRTYTVQIGDQIYPCSSYSQIYFDVPVEKTASNGETAFMLLAFVADLAFGSSSSSYRGVPEVKFSTKRIPVFKLTGGSNDVLYVISEQGLEWIERAMKKGYNAGGIRMCGDRNTFDKACYELYSNCKEIYKHLRDHPSYDWLPRCTHDYLIDTQYTKDYAILYIVSASLHGRECVVTTHSIDAVAQQLTQQDKKYQDEQKRQEEEIERLLREEEQRKKQEEQQRREAEQRKREDEERRRQQEEQQRREKMEAELKARAEKQRAAEAELERKRKSEEAKRQRASKRIKTRSKEIISDFEREHLLRSDALPTRDKCDEYRRVREFCIRYLPELATQEFQVKNLSMQYPQYIDATQCAVFEKNWAQLSTAYFSLKRGITGEDSVNETLSLYNDRLVYIRNYRGVYEHDFVVITPGGIFTVEVKTLSGKYILNAAGHLRKDDERGQKYNDRYKDVKRSNVGNQSIKHIETLRRTLKGCPAFHKGVPLQDIICNADPDCIIEDECHEVPICYSNYIGKVLLPTPAPKAVLTRQAMNEIKQYLLEHQEKEKCFDLFSPRGELDSREAFIRSFASVASGVECAKEG